MKTLWRRLYWLYEDYEDDLKPISRDWRCWNMLKVWMSHDVSKAPRAKRLTRPRPPPNSWSTKPKPPWPDMARLRKLGDNSETTRRQLGDNLVHLRSSEIRSLWIETTCETTCLEENLGDPKCSWNSIASCVCVCHKWPSALRLGFRLFWTIEPW